MMENVTLSTFTPYLHTVFRTDAGAAGVADLVLVEATDAGSVERQEQFSLVFRGPHSIPLPQRSYGVEHEHLGAFELFLVPVGRDGDGLLYEAFFNLLKR
jgi:hypothetical protein